MAELYPWIKALHIMAVIAWMAGLLYLPRLFVYHRRTAPGSESSELFRVMEQRLARVIMTPAMIASWIFGLTLAWIGGWGLVSSPWFIVKAVSVVVMSGYHDMLLRYRRDFAADNRPRSENYFRAINEVPAVLMAVIVVMVVVRPW